MPQGGGPSVRMLPARDEPRPRWGPPGPLRARRSEGQSTIAVLAETGSGLAAGAAPAEAAVGTGASFVVRSGISLIATAAIRAMTEPTTPSQNVRAGGVLKRPGVA